MLHNRLRIAQLFKLVTRHRMKRIMYRLALEVLELGHPVADIVAFRVALLGLCEGVEYAEIGLGVCAGLLCQYAPLCLLGCVCTWGSLGNFVGGGALEVEWMNAHLRSTAIRHCWLPSRRR